MPLGHIHSTYYVSAGKSHPPSLSLFHTLSRNPKLDSHTTTSPNERAGGLWLAWLGRRIFATLDHKLVMIKPIRRNLVLRMQMGMRGSGPGSACGLTAVGYAPSPVRPAYDGVRNMVHSTQLAARGTQHT